MTCHIQLIGAVGYWHFTDAQAAMRKIEQLMFTPRAGRPQEFIVTWSI